MEILTAGGTKRQVVGQAELLPCVAARVVWAGKFADRKVMHFVDNEAVRFALIKGSSPTADSAWVTGDFWTREAAARSFSWSERVPSPSNPADAPSRGAPVVDLGLGLQCLEVNLPPSFEEDLAARWFGELGAPRRNARGGPSSTASSQRKRRVQQEPGDHIHKEKW